MDHRTKKELINLCKTLKWRGYSKYNKEDLLKFIERKNQEMNRAARAIQRWFRKILEQEVVNNEDFVTLEAFGKTEITFNLRENLKVYRFNPRNLLKAMLMSGIFENPYTRTPLSPLELGRLHRCFLQSKAEDLSYTIDGVCFLVDRNTDFSAIKHPLRQYNLYVHERQRILEVSSNQVNDTNSVVMDIMTDGVVPDPETVMSIILYVCDYHFPILEQEMFNVALINYDTAQALLRVVRADINTVAVLSDLHGYIASNYLELLDALDAQLRRRFWRGPQGIP